MGAVILACILLVSLVARPGVIMDPRPTSIAMAALVFSSCLAGCLFAGRKDRSAQLGFAVGLPLGFMFFQNSIAREAHMIDLASGSATVMAGAGIVAAVSSVASWMYRRSPRD